MLCKSSAYVIVADHDPCLHNSCLITWSRQYTQYTAFHAVLGVRFVSMASAYFKQEPDDISSLFHTLSPEPYLSTKRKREDLDSKEDAKPRKRPTISYRECLTCCTDKPLNQYPKLKHAAAHASDVCRKCWSQHLGTQITDKDASSVQCVQCEHKLTEPEIRKLCNSGAYQRSEVHVTCNIL